MSTELTAVAGAISSSDIRVSIDHTGSHMKNNNEKNRKIIQNLQNNFKLNYINTPVLNEIMNIVCVLLDEKSLNQIQRFEFSVELQKSGQTLDETTLLLEDMEMKYTVMKSRVFEAKALIDKQGIRYQELLDDFSVLSISKDVEESLLLDRLSEDLKTERNLRGEEKKYFLNEVQGLEIKLEDASNRLKESLFLFENMAEYSISLVIRCNEILIEKKVYKKSCGTFENLKSGVGNISQECIRIFGNPDNPNILDFRIHQKNDINNRFDMDCLSDDLYENRKSSIDSRISIKNKKSLRVVVIYILAGLRFIKIMRSTILETNSSHVSIVNRKEISTISILKKFSNRFESKKISSMINENNSFPSLLSLIARREVYNRDFCNSAIVHKNSTEG